MAVKADAVEVDLQVASDSDSIPDHSCFQLWAATALEGRKPGILTIRLVDREESADLNQRFRKKAGPTNVLSFAADVPAGVPVSLLGDIVICVPLLLEEASAQGKAPEAHWAHLVIHGVLHLLGFDHEKPAQAEAMEALEIALMARLGYPDPYA